ncbi:hypothetical protein EDC01DRAFT_626520 [Geopyxis carbonaria]|nr:hypothetical protein EDC01DRAFT_626520 [Geopyxis carbonaria]
MATTSEFIENTAEDYLVPGNLACGNCRAKTGAIVGIMNSAGTISIIINRGLQELLRSSDNTNATATPEFSPGELSPAGSITPRASTGSITPTVNNPLGRPGPFAEQLSIINNAAFRPFRQGLSEQPPNNSSGYGFEFIGRIRVPNPQQLATPRTPRTSILSSPSHRMLRLLHIPRFHGRHRHRRSCTYTFNSICSSNYQHRFVTVDDPCLFSLQTSISPEEVSLDGIYDRDGMYDGDDEDDDNNDRLSIDEDGAVVIRVSLNCRMHGRGSITHDVKLYTREAFRRRFEEAQEDIDRDIENGFQDLTMDS